MLGTFISDGSGFVIAKFGTILEQSATGFCLTISQGVVMFCEGQGSVQEIGIVAEGVGVN